MANVFELSGFVIPAQLARRRLIKLLQHSAQPLASAQPGAKLWPYVFRNVWIGVLPCFLLISPCLSPWRWSRPGRSLIGLIHALLHLGDPPNKREDRYRRSRPVGGDPHARAGRSCCLRQNSRNNSACRLLTVIDGQTRKRYDALVKLAVRAAGQDIPGKGCCRRASPDGAGVSAPRR